MFKQTRLGVFFDTGKLFVDAPAPLPPLINQFGAT